MRIVESTVCENCFKNTKLWSEKLSEQYYEFDALMKVASRLTGLPQEELVKLSLKEINNVKTK